MQLQASETAIRRARKRFAHATAQLAEAQTEKARRRHSRRAMQAQRTMSEAVRLYEAMALEGFA